MTAILRRRRTIPRIVSALSVALAVSGTAAGTSSLLSTASAAATTTHHVARLANITTIDRTGLKKQGELDCNGFSPVQKPTRASLCTDIRGVAGSGNQNTWGGHFYDNGHYIGHDEPDTTFLSSQPGSGGNVAWNLTLGKDPTAAPTVATPGSDVAHWLELSAAPWLSMALCDSNSYPQLPCTPNSNSNAPSGSFPGGGSAFMELQFYPPGNAPFVDNESCNNANWCAALTIDSLECTTNFVQCNTGCEEPVNFGFAQTNGVPTGPPSPRAATFASFAPNSHTLLMNPGDSLSVHIFDAPVPGEPGQHALKIVIDDLTTGKTGYMQASAKNGFQNTSIVNCAGTPYNFQPEYSTASVGNYVPWAALQTDISTEFETGHFEPCTSLSSQFDSNPFDPYDTSPVYNQCNGPYETTSDATSPETGDALCYYAGSTHVGYNLGVGSTPPNIVTGCQDNTFQNGDLNFDGSAYWPEWPTGPSPTGKYPGSFVESLPTTGGQQYPRLFFQTDVTLSESTCAPTGGCSVPPQGPGHFYPYWSEKDTSGTCTLEFGNVSSGVNDFGKDAQYGTAQWQLGYPESEGKIMDNTCYAKPSQGYLLAGKAGQVVAGGDAPALGSVHTPKGAIVGIVQTPDGKGYFSVTDTGAVYVAGDATFHGDLTTLSAPVIVANIVSIVATPDGGGYWLVGSDGGLFAFGDAKYHGSLPGIGIRVRDIVAMVSTSGGAGYLLVGADGGVFAFANSHYYGSLPGIGIHVTDIRAALPATTGVGYTLVGADGGVFVFGSGSQFHGSLPGEGVKVSDIVGAALTSDGAGYWMAGANGSVYHFGDARSLPSTVGSADLPITAITSMKVDFPGLVVA